MQAKKLADYVAAENRKVFDASHLTELTLVEPNYADYVRWNSTAHAARNSKDETQTFNAVWPAVDAVVRAADPKVKQFFTEEDFASGPAKLHIAIGVAATNYLFEYTNEDSEKKAK